MICTCRDCGRTVLCGVPHPRCVCGSQQIAVVPHEVEANPAWVGIVSYFRTSDDTGVGDTVQRYAAILGGEQFKVWAKKLGMPCGCTTRQAEWNARYPYTAPHDQQQSSSH